MFREYFSYFLQSVLSQIKKIAFFSLVWFDLFFKYSGLFSDKNILASSLDESDIFFILLLGLTSLKKNTVYIWPSYGYFRQQPCNFGFEKEKNC